MSPPPSPRAGSILVLLILELTEHGLYAGDVQTTVEQKPLLKERGARTAIDYFGTGHSIPGVSEPVLPSTASKIVSSNPLSLPSPRLLGKGDRPHPGGAVKLLGLETTAEKCIESHDQWMMLQRAEVDNGQGFLSARPQSVAAMDLWSGAGQGGGGFLQR